MQAVQSALSSLTREKLEHRVRKDTKCTPEKAALIVEEAARFLTMCGTHRGYRFVPSPDVDSGWHAFVLHTKEYREFCTKVCGWFIDHAPTWPPTKGHESMGDDGGNLVQNPVKQAKQATGAMCCNDADCCGNGVAEQKAITVFHSCQETVAFMQKNGIEFCPEMWVGPTSADCVPDPCTCTGEEARVA